MICSQSLSLDKHAHEVNVSRPTDTTFSLSQLSVTSHTTQKLIMGVVVTAGPRSDAVKDQIFSRTIKSTSVVEIGKEVQKCVFRRWRPNNFMNENTNVVS